MAPIADPELPLQFWADTGAEMVAIAGVILQAVGIFLMLLYRLPDNLPRLVVHAPSAQDTAEDQQRKALGMIGLVTVVAGTSLIMSFFRAGIF